MAVIGIDLGTTYSAASIFRNNATEIIFLDGNPTLPSVVSVRKNGDIVVGHTAKRNQAKNPQDTIVEIKRKMGQSVQVRLGQKEFSPQEISAMILREIKEQAEAELGEEITGVVISCPAYFKDDARHAVKEAGELAGLQVLRVINEPTAAAYAYGRTIASEEGEKIYLVYDMGGGTFDVTVIRVTKGDLKVLGTGGDPFLGGGNFDDAIVKWIWDQLRQIPGYGETLPDYDPIKKPVFDDPRLDALRLRLKADAEIAKIKLCGPPPVDQYKFQIAQVEMFEGKPVTFTGELTMETFESLIFDLVKNSFDCIDTAMQVPKEKYNYDEGDISAILLVGGSTRVPLVHRMILERFPEVEVRGLESGINPDEIVARGAGIVAADIDPDSDEIPVSGGIVDVTGHTLSVAAMNEQQNEVLIPIIPKDTIIPTRAKHTFASQGNFQRQCKIRVFQGEASTPDEEDAKMIGEFLITIDPIQDPIPIDIGLDLNADGLLVAHATNRLNGHKEQCEINYEDSSQLPTEEIEKRKAMLEAYQKSGVGTTPNPLEQNEKPQPSVAAAVSPQPSQNAFVDPAQLMNPIMRSLYQKAINNFGKIAADKRTQVMMMVSEIEMAAKSGDQNKLMSYFDPLSQLLDGID